MKKIYSIVLMATMLLVGTSAWANSVWDNLPTQQGANKISVTIGGVTKYAANLQTAVDAVDGGQSATIQLLGELELTSTVLIPNYLGNDTASTTNPGGVEPIRTRAGQDITLDLNGFNILEKAGQGIGLFQLVKGTLNIIGQGEIRQQHKDKGTSAQTNVGRSAICVSGAPYAYKNVAWSTLIIGENVYVNATGKANEKDVVTGNGTKNYGITIDNLLPLASPNRLGYSTGNFQVKKAQEFADPNIKCWAKSDFGSPKTADNWTKKSAGCAYGVKIIVKGQVYGNMRGINFAGNINPAPDCDENWTTKGRRYANPAEEGRYYNNFYPYIRIESTATVWCLAENLTDGNGGIYAGGYGVWDISGNVHGQVGVMIKSGDVKLIDATIKSDAQTAASSGEYHGEVSGTGIFIASDDSYAGSVDVEIGGDTKVTGGGASAIVDAVASTSEGTNVSALSITGGTIEPGVEGGITITQGTAAGTQATGGNIQGDIKIDGTETTVTAIVPATGYHTTEVVVDGKTTIVVSDGDAPSTEPDPGKPGNSIETAGENSSIKWVNPVDTKDTIAADKKLAELEINESYPQTLTILTGKKLEVGRVVLGANAQIVVEAGAKFIVTGSKGVVAPVASNIILRASEDAQALFLFHPDVTSNRHPNAKVEYKSNSFYKGYDVQQFFGLPTYKGAVTNIETESTDRIYFDLWRNPGWDYVGSINAAASEPKVTEHLDKFNLPFALVCITSKNDAEHKPSFTFSGELMGNMDHSFTLHQGWTSMSNAYMGPIDKAAIIDQLAKWNKSFGTEQNVYTYDLNALTGAIQWHAKNKYSLPKEGLNAMAPMMFHNGSDVEGIVLDYSDLVWDPYVAPKAGAPARRDITNITKVQINIANESEADYTTIVADSELADDRSFCAPKYDNEGLQLYVMGNEKYDVYAADEIENSYIGYRTVNAGMYTISFENVQGEELVLVDLVNGARTNMAEGAVYTFNADANESNDYRFQIVAAAKMPTSIDETEADASTKKAGVYTLTGQYLGNASVFSALPAGVYVVDGVKKVK